FLVAGCGVVGAPSGVPNGGPSESGERAAVAPEPAVRVAVRFPASSSAEALDGRLLLMLSTDSSAEPRFQVGDGPEAQLIFGLDVDGLAPGEAAVFTDTVFGYPLERLGDVPPGRYRAQALLNR